ncbi:MAG: 2OG-Fe(II) oxygenase [Acidimicrobiales bacterium]
MAAPVIAVDPLYTDAGDAERLVDLAHRFGRYRIYGEDEHIDLDIGRGLFPRHDSVQHFLRTGGARGPGADVATLAARTSYFREEYAYDGAEHIGGVESFLHNPGLVRAAVDLYDRPIVEPAIAFANLMVPGQELAVHTDVPEFRGASRRNVPQWLLVVMHHSGLFDPWRLRIATGIAYFRDGEGGALRYWPDGPDGAPVVHPVRANTAVVLDTDSVFHGVDPVALEVEPPVVRPGAGLVAGDDGRWRLSDADGAAVADYAWDDLRFSVSWKAYCFADEAKRTAWRDHTDDLTTEAVVSRLVDDMVDRGAAPADVPVDRALGLRMIDEYVRYPGSPIPA